MDELLLRPAIGASLPQVANDEHESSVDDLLRATHPLTPKDSSTEIADRERERYTVTAHASQTCYPQYSCIEAHSGMPSADLASGRPLAKNSVVLHRRSKIVR